MRSLKIHLMVSTKKGDRKLRIAKHPARGRENVISEAQGIPSLELQGFFPFP